MDFVNVIDDAEFHNIAVPFPGLEPQDEEAPFQPTDSEGTAYNSSSSTAASSTMDSSLSTDKSIGTSKSDGESAGRSLSDRPSSSPRRMSFRDEMQSIDMTAVDDPASCIKRLLDGFVSELKEEASIGRDKAKVHASKDQATSNREEGTSPILDQQSRLKSGRPKGDQTESCGDSKSDPNQEVKRSDHESCMAKSSSSMPSPKHFPIHTIMTWMDTFQDSETIQLHCLQTLPSILEHSTLRHHAQSEGLASIVFYNMAAFPENFLLQLTAFHTLVVLLRPLGAMEGTLVKGGNKTVKTSKSKCLQNSVDGSKMNVEQVGKNTSEKSSVAADKSNSLLMWEDNGVRVMLDTLRSYSHDRYLQAMGCWAMVNAALYPSLKKSLLSLGGIYVVTNAMMLHPNAEAVQFRGLFALINFVIPDANSDTNPIHSHVYQIARLTILAMQNFQTNTSILNRGCLVLRNLSLTPSHAAILARTPGCVDMLLHSRQVCPRDPLVQRSARTIMILVQRIAERQLIHSGISSSTSAEIVTNRARSGASSQENASVDSTNAPTNESDRKRQRSSCSF